MSAAMPCYQSMSDQSLTQRIATKKVLLLGNDDRVLLAVARGLGREGIVVHAAWCDETSAALKSRYVRQFHRIPQYSPTCHEWLDTLNRLTQTEDFDLVIPCNDYAVVPLQRARNSLCCQHHWYLINDEAFQVAFDKGKTSVVAESLGINTPREYSLSHDEICELCRQPEVTEINAQPLRFPVYVKPRSSITQYDVKNKRAAERIESPTELANKLRDDCPPDGLLIQESFSGDGVGVEVLAKDGKILMQLQHRRLRETIDGGSTYRETIDAIPELSEATCKLLQRLKYTGVAMFEYRYCSSSKEWVFLEINARFWGSLPLAVASGANFPLALYELIVHDRQNFESSYTVGKRCRNLIKDIRAFRKQQNSAFDLRSLLLGRDHLDFLASDDWRPQMADLFQFIASVLDKAMQRIPFARRAFSGIS